MFFYAVGDIAKLIYLSFPGSISMRFESIEPPQYILHVFFFFFFFFLGTCQPQFTRIYGICLLIICFCDLQAKNDATNNKFVTLYLHLKGNADL